MTSPSAFDRAAYDREKRLRRWLLRILYESRGNERGGRVGGRVLSDLLSYAVPPAEAPEDDQHTLRLLSDLVAAGYIDAHDTRTHRDQRFALDLMEYAITAKGAALLEEAIEPDPRIDDPRKPRTA